MPDDLRAMLWVFRYQEKLGIELFLLGLFVGITAGSMLTLILMH